jgi:hypothetical protein
VLARLYQTRLEGRAKSLWDQAASAYRDASTLYSGGGAARAKEAATLADVAYTLAEAVDRLQSMNGGEPAVDRNLLPPPPARTMIRRVRPPEVQTPIKIRVEPLPTPGEVKVLTEKMSAPTDSGREVVVRGASAPEIAEKLEVLRDKIEAMKQRHGDASPALKRPMGLVRDTYNQAVRLAEVGRVDDAVSLVELAYWLLKQAETAARLAPGSDRPRPGATGEKVTDEKRIQGIGAMLSFEDGEVRVVDLAPDSPAAKDGRLKPGDRIVGVVTDEGKTETFEGLDAAAIVGKMRGEAGSMVKLRVIKKGSGETATYEIRRDTIDVPPRTLPDPLP